MCRSSKELQKREFSCCCCWFLWEENDKPKEMVTLCSSFQRSFLQTFAFYSRISIPFLRENSPWPVLVNPHTKAQWEAGEDLIFTWGLTQDPPSRSVWQSEGICGGGVQVCTPPGPPTSSLFDTQLYICSFITTEFHRKGSIMFNLGCILREGRVKYIWEGSSVLKWKGMDFMDWPPVTWNCIHWVFTYEEFILVWVDWAL